MLVMVPLNLIFSAKGVIRLSVTVTSKRNPNI